MLQYFKEIVITFLSRPDEKGVPRKIFMPLGKIEESDLLTPCGFIHEQSNGALGSSGAFFNIMKNFNFFDERYQIV
jgi:predicted transcriptional regulator